MPVCATKARLPRRPQHAGADFHGQSVSQTSCDLWYLYIYTNVAFFPYLSFHLALTSMSETNASHAALSVGILSQAHETCAYIWYSPTSDEGRSLNRLEGQRCIDDLPLINVPYLTEGVSASCVEVSDVERGTRSALLLRLAHSDLVSHPYAHQKLEAVAKLLQQRGQSVHAAGRKDGDLNNVVDFSIVPSEGGYLPEDGSRRPFARHLLASALRGHGFQLESVWRMDKSTRDKLVGRMSVNDPSQAKMLIDAKHVHHSPGKGEMAASLSYKLSFDRPWGFYPPDGLNELVFYAGGACPISPPQVATALQPTIERYNQAHPSTPGSIDEPELISVANAPYVRFRCSHPALANVLSEVLSLSNLYVPAFTYHTNGEKDGWKTWKMREYAQQQKRAVGARRGGKRKRKPHTAQPVKSANTPLTPQQMINRLRFQISSLERKLEESRRSRDGQIDKHSRELVALQEELRQLSNTPSGGGVPAVGSSEAPGPESASSSAPSSSQQARRDDVHDPPSVALQRTLTVSPQPGAYRDSRHGEGQTMDSDDEDAASEAKRARLAYA